MKPNNEERLRIGLLIAERRKKLNITQDQLADRAGVNRISIAKVEKGRFGATVDLLSAIVSPLEMEIDFNKKSNKYDRNMTEI